MVSNVTMKEFCNSLSRELFEEFLSLPSVEVASRSFRNSGNYSSLTLSFDGLSTMISAGYYYNTWSRASTPKIYLQVMGPWRECPHLILRDAIYLDFEEFRTSKEAFAALFKQFTDIFQKPASNGCVKVFYDTSEFMWSWKRPENSVLIEKNGKHYNRKTCNGLLSVQVGEGLTEERFVDQDEMNRISAGNHPDITWYNSAYWLKSLLIPVYRNSLPFETIELYISPDQTDRYEFVMVGEERRYVSLRRERNKLTSDPIHGYTTRIEQLIPADKLFLKGKTDLYARRPSDETPYLGWELEACCNQSTVGRASTAKVFKEHMPWLIMCKSDSSISPEGFETVSVPATLDFWKESNLSSALDSMRVSPYNMRSFSHNSCGFHVHVSRSALSVLDLQKMERFLHNALNKEFITTVAGRSDNTYARYNDKMFSDRKSLSRENRTQGEDYIDDINYFSGYNYAIEHARAASSNFILIGTDPGLEIKKLSSLSQCISSYVSHDDLGRIVKNSEECVSLVEQYRDDLVSHAVTSRGIAWSSVFSSMRYGLKVRPLYYGNLTRDEVAELYKRILLIVCKKAPSFAALVKIYFPEWTWAGIQYIRKETSSDVSWKAGVMKSSAPVGRKFNQQACQVVKGPVGKAVNDRYDILNTRNVNTVEFRLFKGTMNPSSIMRYLEFVDGLVRFVASTSAANDGLNYEKFIKWLMGDSFNTIRYEHLISFIIEKGFLDRKEIKRRELPEVVSDDKVSDLTKLKVVEPVGFALSVQQPLGTFTAFNSTRTEQPVMADPNGYDPDFEAEVTVDDDYWDEGGDDYGASCDCDDCRASRGEI